MIEHMFNLLIVQNREKKVLTIWDQRWEMWLFPYKKAISAEEGSEADLVETKAVRDYFSDLTLAGRAQTECVLKYQEYTSKYSVSDKVHKVYYHRFFQINSDTLPETEEFEISGNRFRWWNIGDLEVDPKTRENNAEIVATVKNRIL